MLRDALGNAIRCQSIADTATVQLIHTRLPEEFQRQLLLQYQLQQPEAWQARQSSSIQLCQDISRYEDSRGGSTGLLHCICDVGKDGKSKVCLSGLLGICSSNDIGTCIHLSDIFNVVGCP